MLSRFSMLYFTVGLILGRCGNCFLQAAMGGDVTFFVRSIAERPVSRIGVWLVSSCAVGTIPIVLEGYPRS